MKARVLAHPRSEELWERAQRIIPAGTQTFSKGPTQYVGGIAPKYLQRAEGARVWDVDGNEYLDCAFGLGAILLGHCYPATTRAVEAQLREAISLTLMHPLEVEVSEALIEAIPSAEMVRFAKNGSDATAGAVRCVRAYTGREHIAHCGYHGWQDWYIGCTTRNRGVPKGDIALQHGFLYNDLDSLARIFAAYPDQVAAVIMEPVQLTEPQGSFLTEVVEVAHSHGALVIFDEIVTGFRLALGGAQEHYGVAPDLTCVGKGLGNGLPISAVVGRAEMMQEFAEIFFSFTFGGECLSLAAAKATLHELRTKPVHEHLWRLGRRLRDGCIKLVEESGLEDVAEVSGLPPRVMVAFKDAGGADSLAVKSLFQQEAIKRGVLYSGQHFMCYSHTDADIDYMLEAYQDALTIVKQAVGARAVEQRLEGTKVQPVFRPVA
jgi:glutamate-1-semialdehyde aminotransferase